MMMIPMAIPHMGADRPHLLLSEGNKLSHTATAHTSALLDTFVQSILLSLAWRCDKKADMQGMTGGRIAKRGDVSGGVTCREPLTYKEFMFKLPDDITPEEAQKEYQRYLAEYWGSEIRAEFQAKKNEGW